MLTKNEVPNIKPLNRAYCGGSWGGGRFISRLVSCGRNLTSTCDYSLGFRTAKKLERLDGGKGK